MIFAARADLIIWADDVDHVLEALAHCFDLSSFVHSVARVIFCREQLTTQATREATMTINAQRVGILHSTPSQHAIAQRKALPPVHIHTQRRVVEGRDTRRRVLVFLSTRACIAAKQNHIQEPVDNIIRDMRHK